MVFVNNAGVFLGGSADDPKLSFVKMVPISEELRPAKGFLTGELHEIFLA